MIFLEFVVVVVGVRPKLQFLDLHHVLFLLSFVLLFFLLILIVAIVDGLGDRWNGRGSNQNQIETHILGFPQSHGGGHDFRLTVWKYSPNFTRSDGLVYIFSAILLAGRKLSAWRHELVA